MAFLVHLRRSRDFNRISVSCAPIKWFWNKWLVVLTVCSYKWIHLKEAYIKETATPQKFEVQNSLSFGLFLIVVIYETEISAKFLLCLALFSRVRNTPAILFFPIFEKSNLNSLFWFFFRLENEGDSKMLIIPILVNDRKIVKKGEEINTRFKVPSLDIFPDLPHLITQPCHIPKR